MILTLFILYALTLGPASPVSGRFVVERATPEAVEVFTMDWSDWLKEPYDSRIEPFNYALDAAMQRTEAHPKDLAPPYLLKRPYRLVAPYITERGRALAAAPLTGVAWPDHVRTPFTIIPVVRQVRHSKAELEAVLDALMSPAGDPRILGGHIDVERNRAVIEVNDVDLQLRRQLAQEYGSDLVAIQWSPGEARDSLTTSKAFGDRLAMGPLISLVGAPSPG
ncbi:hypothetical protein SAMN05421833_12947 [Microbispora rosea]|uniref:Uncharacterized protein n=1 Tax=Microbispora rosea TaxID=58117 RepID=A0A1N7GI87_9ACTN|nr:hypothetical protein SAMN05421833_12947 [Microbispora rosea]